jgi:hypothetical protein
MNEEYEVIEFEEIRSEVDPMNFFDLLESKVAAGYRI